MWRLVTLAAVLVSASMSPTAASGQYTFGDWARDQGYLPGDAMPGTVDADASSIDSLDGIGNFDWTTTPTTRLKLRGNQLSSIESGNFSGLVNLEQLRLRRNQLSSIESGDFSGLANLELLDLNYNQISSIESGDFSELTNLRELVLNDNQISSIESGDFSELTNLRELDLNGNQISSIEPGTFSELTNLYRLELIQNQLTSIESGDLSGLTNLTELVLGGNQLSSIESGDFDGLTNLTELFLYDNQLSSIESGAFSGLTNLRYLGLSGNQLSSIERDDFSGLTTLRRLDLYENQLSSIESGAFSGLPNLGSLDLSYNTALTELNLAEADFSRLTYFHGKRDVNITNVSLRNTVLNQRALVALLDGGGGYYIGIGALPDITKMDLSGVDFGNITDLSPLYVMDDLTDLWLVDTANMDAGGLDILLDNLATIEGTSAEGVLYMTEADFHAFDAAGGGLLAAWDAEPGHHVEYLLLGDVNHDTDANGLDVDPFVDVLLASQFDVAADMNGDGAVNGLDVDPFVAAVISGGAEQIPEPSTLLLGLLALGVVGAMAEVGRRGIARFPCSMAPGLETVEIAP